MSAKTDINLLPKIPYLALRRHVQTGDILFYGGDDDISRLICEITSSIWSHVGIIYKMHSPNRVMLLESVESSGVRLIPLSTYIKGVIDESDEEKPDARLLVARHKHLEDKKIDTLINFGLDQIGQPYDLDEVRRIMHRIRAGEGKAIRDKAYMCSELVYECFKTVDIEIPYNTLGFISPQDIWIDNNVVPIAMVG